MNYVPEQLKTLTHPFQNVMNSYRNETLELFHSQLYRFLKCLTIIFLQTRNIERSDNGVL